MQGSKFGTWLKFWFSYSNQTRYVWTSQLVCIFIVNIFCSTILLWSCLCILVPCLGTSPLMNLLWWSGFLCLFYFFPYFLFQWRFLLIWKQFWYPNPYHFLCLFQCISFTLLYFSMPGQERIIATIASHDITWYISMYPDLCINIISYIFYLLWYSNVIDTKSSRCSVDSDFSKSLSWGKKRFWCT